MTDECRVGERRRDNGIYTHTACMRKGLPRGRGFHIEEELRKGTPKLVPSTPMDGMLTHERVSSQNATRCVNETSVRSPLSVATMDLSLETDHSHSASQQS